MKEIPDALLVYLESFKVYIKEVNSVKLALIQCVSEGMSNGEIARRLFFTESTVKTYISEILLETGLKNRTQMAFLYFILTNQSTEKDK